MSGQSNDSPMEGFSEISKEEEFKHFCNILNRMPRVRFYTTHFLSAFLIFSLTDSDSHPFLCRLPHRSVQLPSLENLSHAASRFLKSRGWQGREKYLQGLVTNPGFGLGDSGLCLLSFKTLGALSAGSPLMGGVSGVYKEGVIGVLVSRPREYQLLVLVSEDQLVLDWVCERVAGL